ncbi:disintegrin and metalloproteinase domain-containing protein 21-like [Tiliqua scincoides]|uniref:disintegrin and metalloproteinase domain-containing protein 21-like n=1 Tax=Tiliqua scincoides TaxID=71010 RepID=UPI0034634262
MTKSLAWLLVLVLRSRLQGTAGQTPPQGFRYVSYEVIIPRKLISRYGQDPADLTYLLPFERKGHLVHLRQSISFAPKHFPVYTYSEMGGHEVDYPFIRDDCYYHGFLQEKPSSWISLNICSGGLRGVLSFDKKLYEVEPAQPPADFQHVVYQLEANEGELFMRCGLTEEEQIRQDATILKTTVASKSNTGGHQETHTRPVNVAVVVEHELYVRFNRNKTLTLTRVLDVIQIASALYKPLGVHLYLVGLEIWSEMNFIEIGDTIEGVLDNFNSWSYNTLLKRLENDATHLFVYKSFGHKEGLAFRGTLCNNRWASAVESYVTSSLFLFANLFAHELGHILGMQHDGEHCTCDRPACIMAAFPVNTDQFSNCSYDSYSRLRNSNCMVSPLEPKKIDTPILCGNKVVEHGEQCDCGSEMDCLADPCCESNCKLKSGATCAFGKCCADCQYLPAGTICRESTSICDLPEYCNGTSGGCPEDFYVHDGAPCMDGAYCYHGHCATHREQCREIFGKKATVASKDCFREVNAQGDRFGNCGLRNGSYSKCNADNVLCGRIQCVNVGELPSSDERRIIIQASIGETECWSTHHLNGANIGDVGAVRDGTPCGADQMCVKGTCISVFSHLKYECNITNRGICNNHKHFHCNYGWAPPDCLEKGYGGSIDSGPTSPRKRGPSLRMTVGTVLAIAAVLLTGDKHVSSEMENHTP